jgi:hypothetical protein
LKSTVCSGKSDQLDALVRAVLTMHSWRQSKVALLKRGFPKKSFGAENDSVL